MKNYSKTSVIDNARTELRDILDLSGAEISINTLPLGTSVPFVHSHKQNEEIYFVLEGKGFATIDNEKIALNSGDWLRIAPQAKRQFSASAESLIKYICIQVKENSLQTYTAEDAVIN